MVTKVTRKSANVGSNASFHFDGGLDQRIAEQMAENKLPPNFSADAVKWFEQQVAADTAAISHDRFVAGLKDGTVKVTTFKGNPNALVIGALRKRMVAFYVIFYLAAPLILVPLWTWRERNLWLLLGVAASYAATFITRKRGLESRQYAFASWIFIASILAWIFLGLHNYYTYFLTCALFGTVTYLMAEETQQRLIRESLIEDPAFFAYAVGEERIWIATKSD